MTVGSQLLDIVAEWEVGTAKGFGLSVLGRWVGYDAAAQTLNGIPLKPVDGKIRLRFLVDRSSLEICGNDGRVAITSPYQAGEKNMAIEFRADGAPVKLKKLEIHEMKSIWHKARP